MSYREAFLGLASLSAVAMLAGVSSAAAEWIYKKEEKAFGETEAMAMAIGDASVAFVTCNNDGLKISLATPEDWTDGASAMNLLAPKIIVSIDGAPPTRFDAELRENTLHKILAEFDDEETVKRAAAMIASARKRIDIGLELAGKRFHASKLSAVGATKKIQSVLDTCAQQASPDADNEKKTPDTN
ncbi:hypothetical protein [Hyphomicrobium sp. ghe19]|uniref:hypothetical protein n=1 Tax=Hyphomicrobium sp. ghe19 TaxID=2682968 RepID=UPI0013670AEA|nr:hypothetical protein HYPP_03600 [Hyphomicrobium sp. ghe19]